MTNTNKRPHPAYRRRRRKHPAFFSIAYIRNRKVGFNQRAEGRYSPRLRTRAERVAWRRALRQHPEYSIRQPILEADLYGSLDNAMGRRHQ